MPIKAEVHDHLFVPLIHQDELPALRNKPLSARPTIPKPGLSNSGKYSVERGMKARLRTSMKKAVRLPLFRARSTGTEIMPVGGFVPNLPTCEEV
jgi:hypothetical protein